MQEVNQNNLDINLQHKSREFGKDITNAFIGIKGNFDQNIINKSQINTKQAKLADFKNFVSDKQQVFPIKKNSQITQSSLGLNPLNKSTNSINSFNTSKFNCNAQKQSFVMQNLKKNIRKQSSISTLNQSILQTENNYHTLNCQMDVDMLVTLEKENLQHTERINTESELRNNFFDKPKQSFTDSFYTNPFFLNKVDEETRRKIEQERENLKKCPEYIDQIFDYLKEFETENPNFYPSTNYMKNNQFDINEKMRAILLDWLVEVHLKFKLLPETLFITINIIDRYLEKRTIQRTKLQLVGITSMFIACKYEEIYAPEVKDFVFITDKAYTNKEVLEMESDILSALEFNLTMPSSFRFIEIYQYYLNYDPLVFSFIFYLLDLTIVDYRMIKYKASLIGAAVCYVSSKLLHKENVLKNSKIDSDTERLYELSGYSEEEIKICAKDICLIYDYSDKTGLTAIKKKYSLPKYNEVAKIKFGNNK